jgi:hypothetical protein
MGTLMANPLFWQKKTTGALSTAAKFNASCVSPSLVAPSPSSTRAMVSSPFSRAACANPTACEVFVASGVHCAATRSARQS